MATALAYPDKQQGKKGTSVLNTEVSNAYVLSANVHRRHLTKGQQAMATALAYPESEQGKRKTSVLNTEVSNAYLNHARFVLRHCRDKAEEVLRNAKYPLTVAYEEAQEGQGFCAMAGLPDSGRNCGGGGGFA